MNTWLVPTLLAVLTGIVGFVTYITATRANRETARTAGKSIDAEAFDRAKDIYIAALDTARKELASTRDELNSTRAELVTARADLFAARVDIRELTQSSEKLAIELAKLRAQITANGNNGRLT